MRVIIAGPRNLYVDNGEIRDALRRANFTTLDTIIHGGAKGIDSCAERFAVSRGIRSEVYEADWNEHGKVAGPIRNREMSKRADALVIIKRTGEWSKGTANMKAAASDNQVPVYVHEVSA